MRRMEDGCDRRNRNRSEKETLYGEVGEVDPPLYEELMTVVVACVGGCKLNWVVKVPSTVAILIGIVGGDEVEGWEVPVDTIPLAFARCTICRGDQMVNDSGPAYAVIAKRMEERLRALRLNVEVALRRVPITPVFYAEYGEELEEREGSEGGDTTGGECWASVFDVSYIEGHSVWDGMIRWIDGAGRVREIEKWEE